MVKIYLNKENIVGCLFGIEIISHFVQMDSDFHELLILLKMTELSSKYDPKSVDIYEARAGV